MNQNQKAGSSAARTLLIGGAAGGLGSALAHELAKRQAAGTLILLDRNVRAMQKLATTLEAETGVQVVLYPLDLGGAAPQDYVQLADTIAQEYGKLDGLLFAAAQFIGLRPQQQMVPHEWLVELQANLGSSQMLMLALTPLLLQSDDGRVVFVSNDLGMTSKAYWGAYGVAQHGIAALASQWAQELSNTSLRVLHCQPGAMRTSLRANVWPSTNPNQWPSPDLAAARISDWLLQQQTDTGLHTLTMPTEQHSHV